MSQTGAVLGGAACALLLIGAADARAELIQWSYSWSRSPAEVHSDNHNGAGFISLTGEGTTAVTGNSYLVATDTQAHSTAPANDPDVFTHKPYSLSLTLTDKNSQKTGVLTFTGEFNGTLTAGSANIKNSFLGQTTQELVLGDHLYTVKIGPYTPPGPPTETNSGSIAARADVTVSTIFHQPEPGSGVLAVLGAGGLMLLRRRLRPSRSTGRAGPRPGRSS
jgi:hypothetical protein